MNKAERYKSVSNQLFDQAHLELEAGDLIQASEKFWGAAAQALKAIAEQRNWTHKSHAGFYRIVRNIVNETGDIEITDLFEAANELHINFYEHLLKEDEIRTLATQVHQLIQRLDTIKNT